MTERLKVEQKEYWVHLEAASSLEKYPAKQHARRVQEKLGVEHGLIYLPGEPARNNEDSDMPAPFRQRRYFYYLSGCNEPNCHLTYDIENDSLVLFISRTDPARVIWNGRGSTLAEALEKYDIDLVFFIDQLPDFLQDWRKFNRGSLYILHQAQNPLTSELHKSVDAHSLLPAINLARLVKDEHEIALIRKANEISSQAHKEVLANIRNFKNEAQVEGLFLDVCVSRRAKQQAYNPIAASGPNAGTLHYDDNNQDFGNRQLMCLDAGCEWELYASDITRTFPLSGRWPSEEARNTYQLVQRMQETCIQGLKTGVRYLDLHILAHQIAIDGLLSLGILHNGTREEIYKAGTSKAFFPHGLGHHVGLEVHDPGQADLMSMTKGNPKYETTPSIFPKDFHLPVYDPKTCRSPVDVISGHLEEGMVLTVEPGIYFSPYALNKFYLPSPIHSKYINVPVVARYLPVGGVRIEDNLLITSKGYENLTTAPKGEAMLEIIRSQNTRWPFISDSVDLGPTIHANDEEPLLRAPGFPRHMPEPALKSIVRASTAPVILMRDHQRANNVYSEPFDGPSIFSNSKSQRVSTTNMKHEKEARERSILRPQNTICGEYSPYVAHGYINFPSNGGYFKDVTSRLFLAKEPACRKCTILMEAVSRLRENLNKSELSSQHPTPRVEPAATRKVPGMEQRSQFTTTTPVLSSSREPPRAGSRVSCRQIEKVPIWAKPDEADVQGDALECFDFDSFLPAGYGASIPTSTQTEALAPRLEQGHMRPEPACEYCQRSKVQCATTGINSKCKSCTNQFKDSVYSEKPVLRSNGTQKDEDTDAKTSKNITRLLAENLPVISAQTTEQNRLVCEHCRGSKTKCVRWSLSASCTACVGAGRDCSALDTALSLPQTSMMYRPCVRIRKFGDPKADSDIRSVSNPPLFPPIENSSVPTFNEQAEQLFYPETVIKNFDIDRTGSAKQGWTNDGVICPGSPPLRPHTLQPEERTVVPTSRDFSLPLRNVCQPRSLGSHPMPQMPVSQTLPPPLGQNWFPNSNRHGIPSPKSSFTATVPRLAKQLACNTCRTRRARCDRIVPEGPCVTCDRNGFICESGVSTIKSVVEVAQHRGCDTCRRRNTHCFNYHDFKDCEECKDSNLVCEDSMRAVALADSEEKRIELLQEVDKMDGLVEQIENMARLDGGYENMQEGTRIWNMYEANGITPYMGKRPCGG